jgi:RNA polymerase sigma-70 factor (ECF subfamily)
MPEEGGATEALLKRALGGNAVAMRELVTAILPVVEARVARALFRSQERDGGRRSARQEIGDLTQEVFASLFNHNARALRAWDAERGMSLTNFVGLIAEREVCSLLRTGRHNPWTEDPTLDEDLDGAAGGSDADALRVLSCDLLSVLLDRLRERLSPRGLRLFEAIVIDEVTPEAIAAELGMTVDAVYAWRGRFLRLARKLLEEIQAIPPSERATGDANATLKTVGP